MKYLGLFASILFMVGAIALISEGNYIGAFYAFMASTWAGLHGMARLEKENL